MNTAFEVLRSLSNREVATIFWAFLVAALALINSQDIRSSALTVVKAFSAWKIQVALLIFFAYQAGFFYFAKQIHPNIGSLTKNQIVWAIFSGGTLFFNSLKAKGLSHFKRQVLDLFKISLLYEFVLSFFNLSLVGEIVFIPTVSLFVGLTYYSSNKEEYLKVNFLLKKFLNIIGLSLIAFAIFMIVFNPQEFFSITTLFEFATPFLLVLYNIPSFYLMALVGEYEKKFYSTEVNRT